MGMVGITKESVRKAYQTQDADGKTRKHLVSLCKDYQIMQMSPGTKFDDLANPAIEYIMNRIDLSSIIEEFNNSISGREKAVRVSLYHFISKIFIGFGQEAYFGKILSEIEPSMISHFMTFDSFAWQVLYQYPSFLCGKMLGSKTKMHTAFERDFSMPVEKRRDAAWMILELEKDMKTLGVVPSRYVLVLFPVILEVRRIPASLLAFNPSPS